MAITGENANLAVAACEAGAALVCGRDGDRRATWVWDIRSGRTGNGTGACRSGREIHGHG
jgi:hypothetical protein